MIEDICDRSLYKWDYNKDGDSLSLLYIPKINETSLFKPGINSCIIPFTIGLGYFINEVTTIDIANMCPLYNSNEIPFSIALYGNIERDRYSYYYQNFCTKENFWQKINELLPEIKLGINRYLKYLPKDLKEKYATT